VDAHMKPHVPRRPERLRQAGFSMVEMLMAAFIMSIGLLGLAMLQVMSVSSSTGSRMQSLAIGVGQNILESIDAEARQLRLFRTIPGSGSVPTASGYFGSTAVAGSYNVYGTPVNTGSSDPLEKTAIFSTTSTCALDTTGASAASGKVYTLTVVVNFTDGTATRTQTFRRKVTI
jgi:type IV pilus modification protein PilV